MRAYSSHRKKRSGKFGYIDFTATLFKKKAFVGVDLEYMNKTHFVFHPELQMFLSRHGQKILSRTKAAYKMFEPYCEAVVHTILERLFPWKHQYFLNCQRDEEAYVHARRLYGVILKFVAIS